MNDDGKRNPKVFCLYGRSWSFICGSFSSGQGHTLPLQTRVLEIQNQTDRQFSHFQIVQHLASVVIRDLLNRFRVHHNLPVRDQIRRELTDVMRLVENLETPLLIERNTAQLKLQDKRVLVTLLIQPMP